MHASEASTSRAAKRPRLLGVPCEPEVAAPRRKARDVAGHVVQPPRQRLPQARPLALQVAVKGRQRRHGRVPALRHAAQVNGIEPGGRGGAAGAGGRECGGDLAQQAVLVLDALAQL